MKTFTHQAAQGDLLITKIAELPKDAVAQDAQGENFVLAHSETGHHHVVPAADAALFGMRNGDQFMAFLVVKNQTEIRHNRSYDQHEALVVPPGTYQINRQREYTPEGFRRAQD